MLTVGDIKLYLITLIIYIAIDFVWLKIMHGFYAEHLGLVGQTAMRALPGMIAWGLIVLGLIVFVKHHVVRKSLEIAIQYGALYGLIVYGVYNFTNYTTLAGWSSTLTLVDMLWGVGLNTFMAVLIQKFSR